MKIDFFIPNYNFLSHHFITFFDSVKKGWHCRYQTIAFYDIQQEAPALTTTAAVPTGHISGNTAQAGMNGSCRGTAKTPAGSHAKLPTFGKVETSIGIRKTSITIRKTSITIRKASITIRKIQIHTFD